MSKKSVGNQIKEGFKEGIKESLQESAPAITGYYKQVKDIIKRNK